MCVCVCVVLFICRVSDMHCKCTVQKKKKKKGGGGEMRSNLGYQSKYRFSIKRTHGRYLFNGRSDESVMNVSTGTG